MNTERSAVLLDIDGVLLPYTDVAFRQEFGARARKIIEHADIWAWATAWEDKARTIAAPVLGLPDTEAIRFSFLKNEQEKAVLEERFKAKNLKFEEAFKLPHLYAWAQATKVQRLVIIDDDLNYGVNISEGFGIPTLHITPDKNVGLTDDHVHEAIAFLTAAAT